MTDTKVKVQLVYKGSKYEIRERRNRKTVIYTVVIMDRDENEVAGFTVNFETKGCSLTLFRNNVPYAIIQVLFRYIEKVVRDNNIKFDVTVTEIFK